MKYKKIVWLLAAVVLLACSCSDSDYLNAVPEGCTALVAVDVAKAAADPSVEVRQQQLAQLLKVDSPKDCGIDFGSKLYLFEAPDGTLGLAAKVADQKQVAQWLGRLAVSGDATQPVERRGFHFSVLNGCWVVGFSSKAMLVMGPVVGNTQAALIQQEANYLSQDDGHSIKGTPMFEKLDSIQGEVTMVAQAHALPEKFVAPFTLGAPKDADASQVLIAAEMAVKDGCLSVTGETFSFNKRVDAALKEAAAIYRPIKGDYADSMMASSVLGIFMNVRGADFLALLQQNKGLMALLAGVNAAIDMDNILRSVDGDMAVTLPNLGEKFDITMAARLSGREWLKDVDYWKRSCPAGGRILDTGKDSYCFTDGQTTFHFGVSPDNQFFAGSSAEMAASAISKAPQPIAADIRKRIVGQKLVVVVSLAGIDSEAAQTATTLLTPLFGSITTIVYTLK